MSSVMLSLSLAEGAALESLARLLNCSASDAAGVSIRAGLAAVYDGGPLRVPSELSAGALCVSVAVELPAGLAAELARVAGSLGVSMSRAARALVLAAEPAPAPVSPLPFAGSIFRPSWARG